MKNSSSKYKKKHVYKNRVVTEEVVQMGSKQFHKFIQSRDKYLKLAGEARSCGDRVAEQNYLQFADHYSRQIQLSSNDVDSNEVASVNDDNEQVEAVLVFNNHEEDTHEAPVTATARVKEDIEELV